MAKAKLGKSLFGARLCSGGDDALYIIAYPMDDDRSPDPDYSVVLKVTVDGHEKLAEFETDLTGIAWADSSLHCLEPNGRLNSFDGREWSDVMPTERPPARLTGMRSLDGDLVAFGPRGTLVRWQGSEWTLVASDLPEEILLDVAKLPSGAMVVVGNKGAFASVEGGHSTIIEAATNLAISSIRSLGNERFVVTGARGFAALGTIEELNIVDPGDLSFTVYNSADFGGETLFAGTTGIYRVEDGELSLFHEVNSKRLAVCGGVLWNLGDEGLSYFNGSDWKNRKVSVEIDY